MVTYIEYTGYCSKTQCIVSLSVRGLGNTVVTAIGVFEKKTGHDVLWAYFCVPLKDRKTKIFSQGTIHIRIRPAYCVRKLANHDRVIQSASLNFCPTAMGLLFTRSEHEWRRNSCTTLCDKTSFIHCGSNRPPLYNNCTSSKRTYTTFSRRTSFCSPRPAYPHLYI